MRTRIPIGLAVVMLGCGANAYAERSIQEYAVPAGAHPQALAPAADGGVWYTAHHQGALGYLDPAGNNGRGKTRHIPLGEGSRPHSVVVGPDGAPWVTDPGLNAILRVDPRTGAVAVFRMPAGAPNINLNAAVFDKNGYLWFTGEAGYYGRLDPRSGRVSLLRALRGRGPVGICATPDGRVYYASFAGSHIARIESPPELQRQLTPPTPNQGARGVTADSRSRIWVSESNSGQLSRYDPRSDRWKTWKLPGGNPQPYAVYVDARDIVWLSDFGADAIVRFDPATEQFTTIKLPSRGAKVRQIHGRKGEIWLPASGVNRLAVIRE